MFDLKAIEKAHTERLARFKALEEVLKDAGKYGDLVQELNVYLGKLWSVYSDIPSEDYCLLPDGIRSQMVNYVGSGYMIQTVNGIDINSLHHIANLLKPPVPQP